LIEQISGFDVLALAEQDLLEEALDARARSSTLSTALMRPTKSKDSLTPLRAAMRTPTAGFGATIAAAGDVAVLPRSNQTALAIATMAIAPAMAIQRLLDCVVAIVSVSIGTLCDRSSADLPERSTRREPHSEGG
jgi:hypothetical protein